MKRILIGCVVVGFLGGILFLITFIYTAVPDLNNFSERSVAQSTKIYDRTGKILLYDVHGTEKRTVIPFDQIPRSVKNATIALEDDTFYQNYGVRPLSILRAVVANLIHQGVEQGGSTITQQLVKNTLLTNEKTVTRKIKEVILALKMEQKYSKDEILNFYLNQIPYGSSAYGIESAAQTFFGKSAADLTLLESAYLVSLPQAPSYYSPCGKHRDQLDTRAHFALQRMLALKFITQDEFDRANKDTIQFQNSCYQGIIAPHFVIEVRDQLREQFGESAVEQGGFNVITTLDVELQKKAEGAVQQFSDSNAKNFNAHNMSVVGIDPKTGDILAMVGSKNYFGASEPSGCNEGSNCSFDPQLNIATRYRQPGSAIKPFVYATAFKKGYTPDTTLFDLPIEFNPSCTPQGNPPVGAVENNCYHPQNYDSKFRGPVTLREALAQSLNVPSVQLLYLAGIRDSIATARDFGITSINDPDRLGLTLVLGGGEVSLLELTSAYGVFANDGVKNPYRYILKIDDANKNTVFEGKQNSTEVIDPNIARAMSDILSDNKARAPEFGDTSALYLPGKNVAVKTGTTNDYRDAWVIGYTPSLVIGAWAGNNDNSQMEKKIAGFIIAPVWHQIMDSALMQLPNEDFPTYSPFPEPKPVLRGEWRGGREYIVDKISGSLATENTPESSREQKVIPEVHSILYWINHNDPLGPAPSNPSNDSQFNNWEYAVRSWAASQGFVDQNESIIPKTSDTIHTPEKTPHITNIQFTPSKLVFRNEDTIILHPIIQSAFSTAQVDYFANDEYVGSIKKAPFEIVLHVNQFSPTNNINIRAVIYDVVGNTSEYKTTISVE